MRLRNTTAGVIAQAPGPGARWIGLRAALTHTGREDDPLNAACEDVLAFLVGGAATRGAATALIAEVGDEAACRADPDDAGLPFSMRSMRDFSLWESHMIGAARGIAREFFPRRVNAMIGGYEKATRRTFPALKPKPKFYEVPIFYMGNHTVALADGEEMTWPAQTEYLDFELELGFVLTKPVRDPTPEQAREAIGGWFVFNDWSARDIQADDYRRNPFGMVIKSKTFANTVGPDVVTADALGDWHDLRGRVRVDGEVWCEASTAAAVHGVEEMVAYAAQGEPLDAGDVLCTGTLPGCTGLELGRWIRPGQTVELEIDGIGSVANRVVR